MNNYNNIVDKLLDKGTYNIEEYSVTLNNDKPLFKPQDYDIVEGEPKYFEPDTNGRSNGAIALLSQNTIPLIIKKKLKYPDPYGWTTSLENKNLFERCHIIAYSLSAKLADKKNIFIGTEFLNTSIMYKIENRIRNHIQNNDVRVLYRVTVKYKGVNQIPTGILIEAQSLDDNYSICKFCYNVQRKVKFDYSNGSIIEDKRLLEKIKIATIKTFKTKNKK